MTFFFPLVNLQLPDSGQWQMGISVHIADIPIIQDILQIFKKSFGWETEFSFPSFIFFIQFIYNYPILLSILSAWYSKTFKNNYIIFSIQSYFLQYWYPNKNSCSNSNYSYYNNPHHFSFFSFNIAILWIFRIIINIYFLSYFILVANTSILRVSF